MQFQGNSKGRRQLHLAASPAAPEEAIGVLVIAGHPMVRSSLARLIGDRPDLTLAGEATTPEEAALSFSDGPRPDVMLLAQGNSVNEIFNASRLAAQIGAPLLVVAADAEADLTGLATAGVSGVLPPDATSTQLVAAIRAVAVGLEIQPTRSRGTLPPEPTAQGQRVSEDPLTEREMQVLQLVARGLPNKGIARRLGISEHTVKFHVGSILGKLDAASRTEAVTQAAHRGLLTL